MSQTFKKVKIIELEERAKNLKSNITTLHNILISRSSTYIDEDYVIEHIIKIYENLRRDIVSFFKDDPTIGSISSAEDLRTSSDDFLILSSYVDQILGFLKGKKLMFEDEKRSFPIDENELNYLPQSTQQLIMEAISEFECRHSYACCCICGLAFESLVKEGCKKYGLEYNSLANGIKALKERGKIKEDLFKTLLDLEKYYRDKISAHVTSEVATDEKARLFLSALLSLGKALFSSTSDKITQ
ncbi:MAG: hypothetical protein NO475_05750 [Candidatus Methanomethylicia archaeon]|nr:hypothetical protein [Candidatus Methanomethylicia archaeon]